MEGEAKAPSGQPRLWQSVVWDNLEPKKVPCSWEPVVRDNFEPKESIVSMQGTSRTRTSSSLDSICRQTVSLFDTLSLSRPLQSQQEGDSARNALGNQNQSDFGPRNEATAPYSRGETDDEDDDPLHELERHRQVLGQQMMMEANTHGANAHGAIMRNLVPVDSDGNPTSIGSFGHAYGTCTVCIFARTPPGCSNGVECAFCHLEHRRTRQKKQNASLQRETGATPKVSFPSQDHD